MVITWREPLCKPIALSVSSVDFMSELRQRFNKEEQPKIDLEKFARLESVFETLAG